MKTHSSVYRIILPLLALLIALIIWNTRRH